MNQISHFNYYQDDEIQAIELPYNKDGMTALIILPKRSVDINKYINSLNSEENSLSELKSKLKYSKVDLELPKFELKYDSSLKKILIDMGMERAFTNSADFSGLSEDKKLKIDNVLHKTYLKVNEVGTEAAAVTAVVMTLGSARPMQEEIYSMKVPNDSNKGIVLNVKFKKNNKIYIEEINAKNRTIPTDCLLEYYEMVICQSFKGQDLYKELSF